MEILRPTTINSTDFLVEKKKIQIKLISYYKRGAFKEKQKNGSDYKIQLFITRGSGVRQRRNYLKGEVDYFVFANTHIQGLPDFFKIPSTRFEKKGKKKLRTCLTVSYREILKYAYDI